MKSEVPASGIGAPIRASAGSTRWNQAAYSIAKQREIQPSPPLEMLSRACRQATRGGERAKTSTALRSWAGSGRSSAS